ncbi:site-specific integrase [Pseudomonas kurunegalensis]|uniref:Site-specific integrase n=1 Tax=Pseudomonas kurunegalensis TaxID=485880 RepID=A0ACC5UHH1_9PSED|nr:site-specific integrase [Pseudomonas kurunegalensis]MBV4513869.1 site-specific integrase [Pseudomonas kurunegalensis]
MAVVRFINYKPAVVYCNDGEVNEIAHKDPSGVDKVIYGFPQLYWSDGSPWDVGNFWLSTFTMQVVHGGMDLATLVSLAYCLRHYMAFLEREKISWLSFPLIQDRRCLFQYHSELQALRKAGDISLSSAKGRSKAVIRLYKAVVDYHLLTISPDIFEDVTQVSQVANISGLERTLAVSKEQLKVRGSKDSMLKVEDGLIPLGYEDQALVLDIAYEHCSPEVYLMLILGFYTGMRLGTICDLKLLTLKHAKLSEDGSYYSLSVGPAVRYAPVATKGGVTGEVSVPAVVYDMLISYVKSPRRLLRAAKVETKGAENLIFINKNGRSYCRPGKDRSSTVNDEISRVRAVALCRGVSLRFKFHETRATFGTNFVVENLKQPNAQLNSVIGVLRGLMLHKSEKTTMTYIRYVQNHKERAKWSSVYFRKCEELRRKW